MHINVVISLQFPMEFVGAAVIEQEIRQEGSDYVLPTQPLVSGNLGKVLAEIKEYQNTGITKVRMVNFEDN